MMQNRFNKILNIIKNNSSCIRCNDNKCENCQDKPFKEILEVINEKRKSN